MNFLITVKIQDGERKYFDYFIMEGKSVQEVRTKADTMIDKNNFETEEQIKDVVEISDHDKDILSNYGVI